MTEFTALYLPVYYIHHIASLYVPCFHFTHSSLLLPFHYREEITTRVKVHHQVERALVLKGIVEGRQPGTVGPGHDVSLFTEKGRL